MEQPICKTLLYKKFWPLGGCLFFTFLLIYLSFVGIFTTIALRVEHPQYYYNLTNVNFDFDLCPNVCRLIANGTVGSNGMKQSVDNYLVYFIYPLMILILLKNIWIISSLSQFELVKIFILLFQISGVVLCFCFIFDNDYQKQVLVRCPIQWQIGAFGLFSSYLGTSYYLQYTPTIGVYTLMMAAVFIRFILFLPALLVLTSGFALCFYMLFSNFDPFSLPILSLQKTAMMITGELNFNDVMYSSDQEAYYKLGYIMFILFAIFMTVITMNLLIGLAVGEIQGLLKQAKYAQLDMTYELARDYEVLRMQLFKLKDRCRTIGFQVEPYETRDMLKIPNHTKFGKWFSNLLARELFADELMDEPTDDTTEQQFNILQELQCGMQKITSKDHDQDEKRKDYQIKKKS
ncbi:unnamed protein product [Rotaria sp. Silwood1]|nr:unnamed protein product [Rotaria sp. Silwood1]